MHVKGVDYWDELFNQVAVAMDYVYTIDSTGKTTNKILFNKNQTIGIATGYIITYDEIDGEYAEIYRSTNNYLYYIKISMLGLSPYKPSADTSDTVQTQSKLDEFIAVQTEIADRLLASSEMIMNAEKAGIDCTAYRNEVKRLYSQLSDRNQELIDTKYFEIQGGITPLNIYEDSLNRILKDKPAVGVVQIPVFVIWAVVIATFAAIAFYELNKLLAGGKSDLSDAKKLVDSVSKLDPNAQKDALKLLNGYYKSTGGTILTIALLAGGAFLAYKFIIKKE